MSEMNTGVFLLLGSNQGNKIQNLAHARTGIEQLPAMIRAASSIYKTAAWGNVNQDDFYNQVIEIATALPVHVLMTKILEIENSLGRTRTEKWGPRIIDIDILLYGDLISSSVHVTVPHPALAFRRFTLVPLVEIAPDKTDPVSKKTMRTLLQECPDHLDVQAITE